METATRACLVQALKEHRAVLRQLKESKGANYSVREWVEAERLREDTAAEIKRLEKLISEIDKGKR